MTKILVNHHKIKHIGKTLVVFGDSFTAPLNEHKHKLFKTRDSYIKLLSRHFNETEMLARSGTGPQWSEELLYRTTQNYKKQHTPICNICFIRHGKTLVTFA